MALIAPTKQRPPRRASRAAAALASVFLVGCSAGQQSQDAEPGSSAAADESAQRTGHIYRDPDDHFAVAIPPGWRRARETLTPRLVNPEEILSLGTSRLPPGGRDCAHVPGRALAALRATDAFVSVQERRGSAATAPPRPQHLGPLKNQSSDIAPCADGPVRFDDSLFTFEDSGRVLHVLVAVGESAPAERRHEVRQILASLDFRERPPSR